MKICDLHIKVHVQVVVFKVRKQNAANAVTNLCQSILN